MKILISLLLIFLWNSTYRCSDEEGLIKCKKVSKKILGTWKGTQNTLDNSFNDTFVLEVTNASKCNFEGITYYSSSSTSFKVKGELDMYGWIEFKEIEYVIDGGEYTNCTETQNVCQKIRWQKGAFFEKAKYNDSEFSGSWKLEGINTSGNSWNGIILKLSGKFNLKKQ